MMVFHQTLEIPAEENVVVVRRVSVALPHPEYPIGTVKLIRKQVFLKYFLA